MATTTKAQKIRITPKPMTPESSWEAERWFWGDPQLTATFQKVGMRAYRWGNWCNYSQDEYKADWQDSFADDMWVTNNGMITYYGSSKVLAGEIESLASQLKQFGFKTDVHVDEKFIRITFSSENKWIAFDKKRNGTEIFLASLEQKDVMAVLKVFGFC